MLDYIYRQGSRALLCGFVFSSLACSTQASPVPDEPIAPSRDTLVPFEESGRWGYLRGDGSLAIAPRFSYAGGFSDGLAVVAVGTFPEWKWGCIDRNGEYSLPSEFDWIEDFKNGIGSTAVIHRGHYGILTRDGILFPDDITARPSFDAYFEFYARVTVSGQEYTWIDGGWKPLRAIGSVIDARQRSEE